MFARRIVAVLILAVFAAVLVIPPLAQTAPIKDDPAASWPLFRGNPLATGVSSSSLPEKPVVVWKMSLEKGSFSATAIIHDGVVYVGDMDGNFYCLDAKTGKPQWAAKAEGEINGGPSFYKDNVLFGSQDATLYCLNAKSGKDVWKYTIADQIRCAPTVVENRCFLAGCDGKLHLIDLDKGEAVGAVPIEAPTGCTPAVVGNRAYFGTEGNTFFAVDWKKEEVAWTFQDAKRAFPFRASAAATSEAIYVGGHDKLLRALNPDNGEQIWSFTTRGRLDSSPVVVGDRVFFAAADGRIYALDRKKGGRVWEYEAGGKFSSSPAVASGRMVIGSEDGTLYCFGEK